MIKKVFKITDFLFSDIRQFHSCIAPVRMKSNGKVRLINKNGAYINDEEYDEVFGNIENNWITVKKGRLYGLLDDKGKVVLDVEYDRIMNFKYGKASIAQNGKTGILNTKGEWIIPLQEKELFPFSRDDKYLIRNNYKVGLVDASGKILIEPTIEFMSYFRDGIAEIYENDKFGYMDNTGEIVVPPKYSLVVNAGFHRGDEPFKTFQLKAKY